MGPTNMIFPSSYGVYGFKPIEHLMDFMEFRFLLHPPKRFGTVPSERTVFRPAPTHDPPDAAESGWRIQRVHLSRRTA